METQELKCVMVVDFSDVAQSCKTYDEFIGKIADVPESDLNYFGVAICGNKKQVNKLTGSLPLLQMTDNLIKIFPSGSIGIPVIQGCLRTVIYRWLRGFRNLY